MTRGQLYRALLVPEPERDTLWESFHESSKITRFDVGLSDQEVAAVMVQLSESLPFDDFPEIPLPTSLLEVDKPILPLVLNRTSGRTMQRVKISLLQLATLLHCAYGITRRNEDGSYPRPFRVVPSAGALYPFEVYLVASSVESLAPGLYHFNVDKHCLHLLDRKDYTEELAECLVQRECAFCSSVTVFLAGCFARSTFKYRDRGYRFALIEAGHITQNLNLVAAALGLSTMNLGGFYDQEIDRLLRLDGVSESVVYLTTVGGTAETPRSSPAS
jgi:SagB-type dehydrogenase family enzyme